MAVRDTHLANTVFRDSSSNTVEERSIEADKEIRIKMTMEDRQVISIQRDSDGNISALCGNAFCTWSPRQANDVISDIENEIHTYHIDWLDGERTRIYVSRTGDSPELRTDKDSSIRNDLHALPDA